MGISLAGGGHLTHAMAPKIGGHLIANAPDQPRDATDVETVRAQVHALTGRFPVGG